MKRPMTESELTTLLVHSNTEWDEVYHAASHGEAVAVVKTLMAATNSVAAAEVIDAVVRAIRGKP